MNATDAVASMARHLVDRQPVGHSMPGSMAEFHRVLSELHDLHKLAHDRVTWRGNHTHTMVFEVAG